MAEIKNVNSTEYPFEISQGVVVADFWAPWCSNCRMLSPVVDQLAVKFAGQVHFIKVNVDENEALAAQNEVQTLPTLIMYKNGEEKNRSVGFKLRVALERMIQEQL